MKRPADRGCRRLTAAPALVIFVSMPKPLLWRALLCASLAISAQTLSAQTTAAAAQSPSSVGIIGVAWSSPDDLTRLQALRYIAPGLAIVAATDADVVTAAGLPVVFTDAGDAAHSWYLADHLHGETQPPGVTIVYQDASGWALLRLQTDTLTQLIDAGHFLYPLPEHYAAPAGVRTFRAAAREPSAAVANLLGQVDVQRLRTSVEELSFVDPALGSVSGNVRSRYARRPETMQSTLYLRDRLATILGAAAVTLDSFRVAPSDSLMYNVVGELPGTDPDAGTYIICAHYDAIGARSSPADMARVGEQPGRWDWTRHPAPGADDNGSGVSVVLESARVLSAAQPFPWGIRFIAFSGEELGLWGSRHYADAAEARGDHILGVLNFDMVGFNDLADRLELVSNPSSIWLVDLMRASNERYDIGLQIDVLEDRFAGLSDHQPFWAAGYDAILGIENYLPTDTDAASVLSGRYRINTQYHSVTDLPDSINWELVARVTRLTVATLAQFGNEQGLPNLAVFPGDLRGDGNDDLRVQISNVGPAAVVDPFDLRVSLCAPDSTACSVVFQHTHTGGIKAGAVASIVVPWQRFGQSVFLVEVDPDDAIEEEVEVDDNIAFQGVRLVPVSGVVIFPNPWRPAQEPVLRFSGVPLFSRLRLYEAGGELVWRGFEEDQGQTSHEIRWSGINDAGFDVSAGIYLYDLRSFEGELLERGKIAVIR